MDKVYIITGGSSGLGKAFTHDLVVNFAKVIITGRDKKKLEKVARDLGCLAFHADVRSDEDIDALMKFTMDTFGKLDGIINNAGVGGWSSIEELSREKMKEVYEVNVFGAAMMASKAAKIFIDQKFGTIVNIASTASLRGYKLGTIYASSKFALRGMTQCWQAELRQYNVRVIQINPSEVPTAFGRADRKERELEENKLSPKEISDVLISALKMDSRGFIPEVSVFATNPF